MVMRNNYSQNACLRMMVLCSVLWSRRVAGPGWIFCPKKQQNKYTRWKVKVVKNTREKNAQTVAPFPGRRVERLRVVLTWVINFFSLR